MGERQNCCIGCSVIMSWSLALNNPKSVPAFFSFIVSYSMFICMCCKAIFVKHMPYQIVYNENCKICEAL